MSGKQWTIFIFLIGSALVLAGLGFAAMSTNPPFTVPVWVPWVFFAAAGIMFLLSLIFVTYSKHKNKRNMNQYISDSARKSVMEYRQEFNVKKQISNQLLTLDTYLADKVKEQDFTGEDFMTITSKHWLNLCDYSRMIFLIAVFPFSITRRIFTKTMINTVLGMSVKFNAALKDLELGTLPIIENDEAYKKLYNEITTLEDGLPIHITTKINRFIFISIALNAFRIAGRDKTF